MPSDSVSSRISKSSQLDINFDFWSFFRICYTDKDIQYICTPSRKSTGSREYACLRCQKWSSKYKGNAVTHARTVHAAHIQDPRNQYRPERQSTRLWSPAHQIARCAILSINSNTLRQLWVFLLAGESLSRQLNGMK